MPLSAIQKGAIGQFAFLLTALVTGKGQLEVYIPAADNEGRDAEVRRHLSRFPGIGIQVKIAFSLYNKHPSYKRRGRYLEVRFEYPERMVRHLSGVWFFLAAYTVSELQLIDPVFLVPAQILLKNAKKGSGKRGIRFFRFVANLDPNSHDRYSRYRVALKNVGARLLEIIDDGSLTASGQPVNLPWGALWVGRHRRRNAKRQLRRAA